MLAYNLQEQCFVSSYDMFLIEFNCWLYLYFRHVLHFSKMIQENQTDKTTVRVQRLDLNWYITHDYQSSSTSIDLDEHSIRRCLQSKGTGQKQKATTSTQIQSKRRREKEQRPCISVLGISILSLSAISILDFETVYRQCDILVFFSFFCLPNMFLKSL